MPPTPEPYKSKAGVTTWRVRFRHRGKQTSETFDVRPEADRFCRLIDALGADKALEQLYAEHDHALVPTLDQWAPRHFASQTSVTEGTRRRYEGIYKRVWSPLLGTYQLDDLNREIIAKALTQVKGSDKTVANAWGVLATMLKVAADDGIIVKSPAKGIKLPRRTDHERAEHRYLTHAEFDQLVEAVPEYWRPLVVTLAGTGMRWGEA